MSIFYRNTIVAIFWALLTFLLIQSNTTQMLLSLLFTVVVLHFSENVSARFVNNKKLRKTTSLLMSATIFVAVSTALYFSFKLMGKDLAGLIEASQPLIMETMKDLGLNSNAQTVADLYVIIVDFLKANIGFITFSAGLLLKVTLGIILGIVVHFSHIEEQDVENAWGSVIHKINEQCKTIYNSFRDIMSIQILIAMMNTAIISAMALGLTYVWAGEFLPYWYVIIPLTAILSLIPVVGNLMINIILILATIQISPAFVLVGLGLFLVIHKLELIVIGNKMNEKVGVPFIVVLFSMILGELLFHSMSGMMIGMVIMVSLSKMMREVNVVQSIKALK